ncbi:MAG: gamma-glutamyltransferase [Bacillota bacterium]
MYKNGSVASAHHLATEAGVSILMKGGNAVDAAVATAIALSVVDPQNSGLGGLGGFATVFLQKEQKVFVVDFGPKAPSKSSPDMFLNSSNTIGHKAVSIPTVLKGLYKLAQAYGSLPFAELFEPAVKIAEEGFPINSALYQAMQEPHLDSETKRNYQTTSLREGDILKLPEYAQILKLIGVGGEDAFYQGEIGDLIIKTINEGKGIITKEDLINCEAKITEPGKINFYGYDIYFPLLYSGGVTMGQILKLIEHFDLQNCSQIELTEILYKVMQQAFMDRRRILEKPDFKKEDVLLLLEDAYNSDLYQKMRRNEKVVHTIADSCGGHTTHLCTADGQGNMVSLTQSNGQLWFGSGVTVKGTGIILNCGMSQYSTDPNHPNAPLPNRKNLSNMTPTIVIKDGKPFLAIGTPGSTRIISIVAAALIGIIVFKRSLKEALDAPRVHTEGDILWLEKNVFTDGILETLNNKYHIDYLTNGHFYGSTTGIQAVNGLLIPEVDYRFPGFGSGY